MSEPREASESAAERDGLPVPLPRGVRCRRCGFDLGGLSGDVCPECGRAVMVEYMAAVRRRERAGLCLTETVILHAAAGGLVAIAAGAIAGFALESGKAGRVAAGLVGAAVAVGLGVGSVASLLAERGSRAARLRLWLVGQWALHSPWLAVGPAWAWVVWGARGTGEHELWAIAGWFVVAVSGAVAGVLMMRRRQRRYALWRASPECETAVVAVLILNGLFAGLLAFLPAIATS